MRQQLASMMADSGFVQPFKDRHSQTPRTPGLNWFDDFKQPWNKQANQHTMASSSLHPPPRPAPRACDACYFGGISATLYTVLDNIPWPVLSICASSKLVLHYFSNHVRKEGLGHSHVLILIYRSRLFCVPRCIPTLQSWTIRLGSLQNLTGMMGKPWWPSILPQSTILSQPINTSGPTWYT